ncbi:MAG: glycosyl hydrolase family 28 protein [Kiritimatiellae bacterium]|jgi:hypothetical protein|nr:glycosyl hydrolase family 28 protein [Kiritimatiellia bacterium]
MKNIEIYEAPYDLIQSRIEIRVKASDSKKWQTIPVMFASSMDATPHANGGYEGWATMSADTPLDFEVKFADPIQQAAIRPSMKNPISYEIDNRTMKFSVESPRYLVLEINSPALYKDRTWPAATLYLLIDEIDKNAPKPTDDKVIYLSPGNHSPESFILSPGQTLVLEPGIHNVEGQMIDLCSNSTIYLQGGAHLRSYIKGEEVDNVSILGRGVIDGTGIDCKTREWRDDGDAGFVFFRRGKNNLIDGPSLFDAPHWNIVTFGTTGTIIRNHKCITWKVNNDGIQPRSCNNMLVENCFLKCADDCIAVKTRRTAGLTSKNLVFRNLVLWNDMPGNAVEIGHTSQADLLEDVLFENIEVVHAADNERKTQFSISISLIDHSQIKNVTYKDFYLEGVRNGDFRLWIGNSRYTTDDEYGRIDGVKVDGYHVESAMTHTTIEGADADHMVRDVTFENITHNNGEKVTEKDFNAERTFAENINCPK